MLSQTELDLVEDLFFYLVGVLGSLVNLVGVAGNLVTLVTLQDEALRSNHARIYLTSLSVVDLVFLVVDFFNSSLFWIMHR